MCSEHFVNQFHFNTSSLSLFCKSTSPILTDLSLIFNQKHNLTSKHFMNEMLKKLSAILLSIVEK